MTDTSQRTRSEKAVTNAPPIVACHECGLVHSVQRVSGGGPARCTRCGAVLYRDVRDSIDRTLTLTLASLILFAIANSFPLLTFKLQGREQDNTLISGSIELYQQGFWELGALVFCLSFLVPLIRLLGLLYVLVPIRLGHRPWKLGPTFRLLEHFLPWAMIEVFMLGLLVAIVKLSDIATIELGIAVYAFAGLIVLTAATALTLDTRVIWQRISAATTATADTMRALKTLVSCHGCDLLVRLPDGPAPSRASCPRCGSRLHRRKPISLSRTWALLIAAIICYIPANMLPIMTVISFGEGEPDTIISGVKALVEVGMYPIALLVFFASIVVPVLKIVVLIFLLVSVHGKSAWRPRERAMLYRMTEAVGRWSMVDIFMISILAALVKLEAIATIEPGAGAVFFAAVVVITLFAAMTFDPRLIWDAAEKRNGGQSRR